MDRSVVEPNATVVIAPAEGVLKPIFVVSLRKIFPGMGAATLRPPNSGMKTDTRLGEHVVEFQHLAQIRVEDHRAVGDTKVGAHHFDDLVELAQTLCSYV